LPASFFAPRETYEKIDFMSPQCGIAFEWDVRVAESTKVIASVGSSSSILYQRQFYRVPIKED
jgi:hypothetical protein